VFSEGGYFSSKLSTLDSIILSNSDTWWQAYCLDRNFSHDKRIQRSFIFKFDYFTIVEEGIQPMPWQKSDTAEKLQNRPDDHIPITRCCSVVGLSLSGDPVKRLRNNSRKARKNHTEQGQVFDPWAPVCIPSYTPKFQAICRSCRLKK
jgi:hypothetical protein